MMEKKKQSLMDLVKSLDPEDKFYYYFIAAIHQYAIETENTEVLDYIDANYGSSKETNKTKNHESI